MSRDQRHPQPATTPRRGKRPAQNGSGSQPSQDRGKWLITHTKSSHAPHSKRSPAKSPPAAWRNQAQMSVALDRLPSDVTAQHLWQWFSPEGTVSHVEISDCKNGQSTVSATVRFEPPPKRAFWHGGSFLVEHPDVRNFPNGLYLSVKPFTYPPRKPSTSQNVSARRDSPVKMTVRLAQLDFGSMIGPAAMVATNSIAASSSEPGDMKLELDVRARRLTVYFPVATQTEHWTGTRQYRFRVDISHVNKIYQTASDDGSVIWVLPLSRPPQYHWKMDDVESTFSRDTRFWDLENLWYRATDIVHDPDAPMRYPVAVHNDVEDPGYIEIGRWTTFRLVLAGHPGLAKTRRQIQLELEGFNVSIERCNDFRVQKGGRTMWDHLDHPPVMTNGQASALLEMPASPVIHVPFEVRYQLEVCVSRGILNENTVTAEFLQKLAALEPFDATRRLEYLVDQHEQLFDPMELFANSEAESYIPNTKIPYYCTQVRKAVITPTTIRYNSPSVEPSNRVVRKYNHMQDRFLRVQFVEEAERGRISINKENDDVGKRVLRTLYQGIRIGDRVYEFLGFGNSQLREYGAYFFCPTEHTSCDDIRQWMGDFNHIRVVAKYAARLGQCFSTTREIRGFRHPKTRRIADIERNGHCFTDGVGIISQFLADLINEELRLDIIQEPTTFQFRMGGCKGVLAVWPQAKGMEVIVRESQEKFKAESNVLEIIRCARFSTATLNRQTITILESLGVPLSAFLRLLNQQIQEYQKAMVDDAVAVGLLTKYVDENQSTLILAELLKAGFKGSEIQEPFTMNLLNLWRSWSLKLLKEKARIQVAKSAFVLGCVDETGTLRGHSLATEVAEDPPIKDVNKLPQIFLQLSDSTRYEQTNIIKGICIVGRNPSLHPGDIRVVQAVDNHLLRHLKDVVVFPSKGDRPLPKMLSGGDLDGDDFFVIWDPDLIPKEWNFPPMDYDGLKPVQLKRDVNVDDIRDFFVKYMKNDVLPLIATSHLAHADLESPKATSCLNLAELHSKAVDYAKTGEPAEFSTRLQPRKWPHFMEKKRSYRSTRALGVIYDTVVRQTIQFLPDWEHTFDQRVISRFELDRDTIEAARTIKSQYDLSVRRILAQHQVATEFELYTSWAMSGPAVGSDYKRQEELGREYDALKSRYREQCYDAAGGSDPAKIDKFVAAMYKVTEQEIKVALHEHHGEPTNEAGNMVRERRLDAKSMPLISFPWIFHRVMIRIATGGQYDPKKTHSATPRRKMHGIVLDPPAVATNDKGAGSVLVTTGRGDAARVSTATMMNGEALATARSSDENSKPLVEKGDGVAAEETEEDDFILVDTSAGKAGSREEANGQSAIYRWAALMGFDEE